MKYSPACERSNVSCRARPSRSHHWLNDRCWKCHDAFLPTQTCFLWFTPLLASGLRNCLWAVQAAVGDGRFPVFQQEPCWGSGCRPRPAAVVRDSGSSATLLSSSPVTPLLQAVERFSAWVMRWPDQVWARSYLVSGPFSLRNIGREP